MGYMKHTFVVFATFGFFLVGYFFVYSGDILSNIWIAPPLSLALDGSLRHGFVISTPGCHIPDWDPFDSTVKKFYTRTTGRYHCPGKPPIIYVVEGRALVVDNQTIRKYGVEPDDVKCYYSAIKRDPGSHDKPTDDKVKFMEDKLITSGVEMDEEYVYVTCKDRGHVIYEEFLPLIPKKAKRNEKLRRAQNQTAENQPQLNILMIGIDSISKLNFRRHMPETYKFLKEYLNPIELHGYTKVGDNTFPNIVPLLTGKFIDSYWNETIRDVYFFDDLDFVWKEYAKIGYKTLLAEDAPNIATFNYLKRGFMKPPTDYYIRPFSQAVEHSKLFRKSKTHCIRNKMEINVIFDYVLNFVHTHMSYDIPFFGFGFAARLTHDYLNNAGWADLPALDLLTDLYESGALNNTLLVFYSDHGIRFGGIRKTYIGKFEERMPYMFLVFPPWFYTKYPKITENLRKNERRLTTPFDIHATMLNVLNLTKSGDDLHNEQFKTEHGISLFNQVPIERTCETASILPHWCTCQIHRKISSNLPEVKEASQFLVNQVNTWTLTQFKEKCKILHLTTIIEARIGETNDQVLRFLKDVNDVVDHHVLFGDRVEAPLDYLLTVSVAPSGAVFEGTVRYQKNATNKYTILGDVSRLNLYGNQSSCISNARLRKFCYCKNFKNF